MGVSAARPGCPVGPASCGLQRAPVPLFHLSRQFFHGIDQHQREGRTVVDPEVLHIRLAASHRAPAGSFRERPFPISWPSTPTLSCPAGVPPGVVAEAHRPHSPQLGEPASSSRTSSLSRASEITSHDASRPSLKASPATCAALSSTGQIALAAHNHIAGGENSQTDALSILRMLTGCPVAHYVDVAVGTLPQGVLLPRHDYL